jgi:site-specific recombinase XerD
MRFQETKLAPFRRHQPPCEYTRRTQLDCSCPLWADGRLKGKDFRRSLATRSLAQAKKKIQRLIDGTDEAHEAAEKAAEDAPTVRDAVADYLGYCEHNKRLKGSTLVSYRDTLHAFRDFCEERLFRNVDQLSLKLFEQWQAERKVTPKTMAKEFTHLAALCARGIELGWLPVNFAKKVKLPKADGVSTLPFKEAEAKALQAACARIAEPPPDGRGGYPSYSADRVEAERAYARALVLTLLTTGLRISDVVNLPRTKVTTDRKGVTWLRIRQEKTGEWVMLTLPPATVQALRNLPRVSEELFFWKGGDERQLATACDRARRVIERLGKLAHIKGARPHRFRDTWAVTALLSGIPMKTIQLVLGHKSIKTTEEHYSPYVIEFQTMINTAMATVAQRLIA